SIDLVFAGLDPGEVGESVGEADGAVATHADDADVVEEDDAGRATRLVRLDEEGAHEDVGAAGLVGDEFTKGVVLVTESLRPIGERALAEVRAAGQDDAGRLRRRV